jgi:hypothetical protein
MRRVVLRDRLLFENFYGMRADPRAIFITDTAPGTSATVAAKFLGGFMGPEVAPSLDAQETLR